MKKFSTLAATMIVAAGFLAGCENKKKERDELVTAPPAPEESPSQATGGAWISTSFHDPYGDLSTLSAEALAGGGPSDAILMTYSKANSPPALFMASASGDAGEVNEVPFLAFEADEGSAISVRHIKSLNGGNISSQLVIPMQCPDAFVAGHQATEGRAVHCLPLINAVVPSLLVPTDNAGSYVHEFVIGLKKGGLGAGVLSARLGAQVIVPGSDVRVVAGEEIRSLGLSDRLTMVTNDLVGSPRRDFPAFEIRGSVAPGVQTAWILTLSDVVMTFDEEIFFEQPVVSGEEPAKPTVSRGSALFKRQTSVSSVDHFKLRILAESKDGAKAFNIASGKGEVSVVEIPIEDGTAPLRVFVAPDFGSESARRSFTEYVRPFGPTFCAKEVAAFKPEEWRQSRDSPGHVACEAISRSRILGREDAAKRGISSPMETYFGAFSYLPRMGGTVLGGTNGVLSLRVHLSGRVTVAVRNPHAPETMTEVGRASLGTSHFFPTVLSEIESIIKSSKATPGLDTILSSMQRKGFLELPRRDGGRLPSFPFQFEERDDIFH